MKSYDNISHEEWIDLLCEILDGMTPENILSIPGVFESISEHFNNEAITLYETKYNGA